jgi:hypothetical protein
MFPANTEQADFACLMKCSCVIWLVAVSLPLLPTVSGQGFVNFDFEQATIAPTQVGGSTYPADPTQAFPGWTVGGSGTVVSYNDLSIGAPAVDLMGPNFPNFAGYSPLQGSYSVLLQYFGIAGPPPTLSQTGLVPASANSVSFLVSSGTSATDSVVTLNGVNIPLVSISGGRLAGDISAFAGGVAELTFSTPGSGGGLYFDNVQFSSSPVPEPGICSLMILGVLLLGWRMEWLPNQRIPSNRRCDHPAKLSRRLNLARADTGISAHRQERT